MNKPKKSESSQDKAVTNFWDLLFRIFVRKPVYGFLLAIAAFVAIVFFSYINTPAGSSVQILGFDLFKKHAAITSNLNPEPSIPIKKEDTIKGISSIEFIVVGNAQNAGPAEGWKWINRDLNADTKKRKDPFIYITWKAVTTSDVHNLITSISVSESKDSKKAKAILRNKGYILVDKDLNEGAGGDFIYVGYKKGEAGKKPIADLRITYGNDRSPEAEGFYRINVDLNAGAGGKYIYLWYRRE